MLHGVWDHKTGLRFVGSGWIRVGLFHDRRLGLREMLASVHDEVCRLLEIWQGIIIDLFFTPIPMLPHNSALQIPHGNPYICSSNREG